MLETQTRTLHVVPHTHWDREWHLPYGRSRYRLVELIDAVLEADLPRFLLDGQAFPLDEYLAVRPDQRELLAERVLEGRISLGPFYTLPDQFLASGEALVRNLLIGRQRMVAFGALQPVAYLPDMHGHTGQLPQILRGFGLNKAAVWRGVCPPGQRFMWLAPDGTAIPAAWLPTGYYHAAFNLDHLAPEERLERLDNLIDAYGPDDTEVLYLAGGDQLAPRADLEALLGELEPERPELDFRISSLAEALTGPWPATEVMGELRDPARWFVLAGVLSTRAPLKLRNAACQTWLERYAEPLAARALLAGHPLRPGLLAYAWTQLLQNQGQDALGGCAVDEVAHAMAPRFDEAAIVAEGLAHEAVRAYDRVRSAPDLYVYNPTPWPFDGWVELEAHWPHGDYPGCPYWEPVPDDMLLEDAEGRPVPMVVRAAEDVLARRQAITANQLDQPARRFELVARVQLPPLGGAVLHARLGRGPDPASHVIADELGIENEYLALRVADGRLDLVDKATGQVYQDCHYFVDEGDAGDSFNFSPLAQDAPVKSILAEVVPVEGGPHGAVLEATYYLIVPEALSDDRQRREGAPATLAITSRFRLAAGSRTLEVETRFDHHLRDHRLRVVARLGPGERPRLFTDAAFAVYEREPSPAPILPVRRDEEAFMPEVPQAGWSALEAPTRALAVAARGVHEVALVEDEAGWGLALTLVRAVGWLSRDDLRTRGGGAGPRQAIPEAQCPGPLAFAYALVPYVGGWQDALPRLHQFLAPPMAWEAEGPVAPGAAVDLGNAALVLSAFKPAEAGDGVILRVYNPTTRFQKGRMTVHLPHTALRSCRLDETPGEVLGDGTFTLRPYEITSWKLEC